jgi:hypothetical protein
VFEALTGLDEPYVVVTADDAMPLDWMATIEAAGVTVAVVDSRHTADYSIAQWYWDVVHRWAHVMSDQPVGSVHRYAARGHREWRPRRTSRRAIPRYSALFAAFRAPCRGVTLRPTRCAAAP